ncbi:hypothetical protein [Corynebacterium sp. A21]|uniref:hypothetical protein n=1 Tax=Corynebacterium sp. A21 TaxID=3457318 RepID=UPI003FD1DEE2
MERASPAENIDRTADRPDGRFHSTVADDEDRTVILDPDVEDEPRDEEFWREQQPPHHG